MLIWELLSFKMVQIRQHHPFLFSLSSFWIVSVDGTLMCFTDSLQTELSVKTSNVCVSLSRACQRSASPEETLPQHQLSPQTGEAGAGICWLWWFIQIFYPSHEWRAKVLAPDQVGFCSSCPFPPVSEHLWGRLLVTPDVSLRQFVPSWADSPLSVDPEFIHDDSETHIAPVWRHLQGFSLIKLL